MSRAYLAPQPVLGFAKHASIRSEQGSWPNTTPKLSEEEH